ncbi:hypothetical protein N7492_003103 [Penicillium capsulatum]|uniref:Life-span regulatory factor domain-containing protein n=1 Tax=Penicillium capsulatum TaxID=69766 RepID=A0A9W9IIV0_9EURO|nr:hypothetical protein N7492_003103 [Penicillium capsulatum]
MTQGCSHRRSPSSPHAPKSKASRPVLHRRGTSGYGRSISKLGSGQPRAPVKDDDVFDMAASFLNFCAMCERQITVPNTSLLYCSESCRRRDSCKPLSASLPSMSSMSSSMSTTPPTSPPPSPRTIVAPMTPTRVPTNPIPIIRIPNDMHDAKTDLDPTEWKPVILPGRTTSSTSLASSDAWNYLSQFHGGDETLRTRRSHRSTTSLPSLVGGTSHMTNTPSTVASSVSSTASDYMGSLSETIAARPLPPRHNPSFSSSAAAKGVELVVPHVASTHEDVAAELSDSGSIFPASSSVWEDTCTGKTPTQPIMMARAIDGRTA